MTKEVNRRQGGSFLKDPKTGKLTQTRAPTKPAKAKAEGTKEKTKNEVK